MALWLTGFLSWAADIMLAVAALYVSGQALRGWWYEKKAIALKDKDADKSDQLFEDAKTFYASATLSKAWVLALVFLGTLIKVALRVYGVFA